MARKLWPYEQAEKALARLGGGRQPLSGTGDDPSGRPRLLFETGYGPSGLPHIGTFCEVARTTWIRHAVEELQPGRPTELYAFSDDMDGLRKVPLNLTDEQRALLEPELGRPLCDIPDPFGCCESYADHNNGELRKMLDRYGFEYTFKSSREQYRSGAFNDGLRGILRHADAVRELIRPTLSEEKRADWSPFLPICESCGRVYSTLVTAYLPGQDAIRYRCAKQFGGRDGCGVEVETPVLDGRVKVGWKVDWALRWFVFGVDYEMYGKDLIESAELSRKITRTLGGRPPIHFVYEMFLDEHGSKISKSVGKGITVDRWLRYAGQESLALFLFRNPRKARRLSWDVIPRMVDEHLGLLDAWYAAESPQTRPAELRFVDPRLPEEHPYPHGVSFAMLLNLVATIGTDDADLVMRYVREYRGAQPGGEAFLREMVERAIRYHRDVLLPAATPPSFDDDERSLLVEISAFLAEPHDEDEIQTVAFQTARHHGLEPKRAFRALYRALSGQDHGPRFGPFVKLVGQDAARSALQRAVGTGG